MDRRRVGDSQGLALQLAAIENQKASILKALQHAQEQVARLQASRLARENNRLRRSLRSAVYLATVFALLAAALGVMLWKQS